jgi:uncharacterized membrane protein
MSIQIHPMIVHFPIVMLIFGVISLWISMWKPDFFHKLANYLLTGGFIAVVLSIVSGNDGVKSALVNFQTTQEMISLHQRFGFLTLITLIILLVLRFIHRKRPNYFLSILILLCSGAVLILVTLAGHYGGQIVYSK